jgi:hypothetical protein
MLTYYARAERQGNFFGAALNTRYGDSGKAEERTQSSRNSGVETKREQTRREPPKSDERMLLNPYLSNNLFVYNLSARVGTPGAI